MDRRKEGRKRQNFGPKASMLRCFLNAGGQASEVLPLLPKIPRKEGWTKGRMDQRKEGRRRQHFGRQASMLSMPCCFSYAGRQAGEVLPLRPREHNAAIPPSSPVLEDPMLSSSLFLVLAAN